MRAAHPSSLRTERGSALVAVLFFAIVSMAYISATLTSTLAVKRQARSQLAAERAHEIAESAVHHLIAKLATDQRAAIVAAGTLEGMIEGNSGSPHAYKIRIWAAAADGADNDQDGVADEADEAELLEVESSGTFDRITRTVRVTLIARYRDADISSATYLDNPSATVNFSGNSFRIKGEDHDIDGNPTGDLVPGIGVSGDPIDVVAQINPPDYNNITGAGGAPSVAQVAPVSMVELIEEGARSADVTLVPDTIAAPANPGDWGTIDSPAIVFCPGNIKIANAGAGAGFLVVDGDLEISGGFQWVGVIVVRGGISFTGGGTGKRLLGALIAQTQIDDEEDVTDLDVRGTVDILFSQQVISKMIASFATFTILNWREGANAE